MAHTFRVINSDAVRGALRELLRDASRQDRAVGRNALAAVRTLVEQLRRQARNLGEVRYSLPHFRLKMHIAIREPMSVTFAVHETKPLVFIQGFRLLPGRGLQR